MSSTSSALRVAWSVASSRRISPGRAIAWIRAAVVTAGPVSDQSSPSSREARDDLAGRDPDPDLERLARRAGCVRQRLPDRQRAVGGSLGVVLVAVGPAEPRRPRRR